MTYILLGLLLISVAYNLFLHEKIKQLRKIIENHADALTTHVKDTDLTEDDLENPQS